MHRQHGINAIVPALLALLVLPARAAQPDTVPLHFIGGLPFVAVTVGAVRSELLFDSGGRLGISLPESTAAGAGTVTLLPETATFSDIHGAVYEVPTLVARGVTVGRTPLAPVNGRVHVQWGGAPEGPDAALTRARAAGATGLAAFGDRPLMFDYPHGTMTLYDARRGPRPDAAGWQALRLEFGKEGPYVMLGVAGKPLKFVLDTGAPVVLVKAASLPADGACAAGGPDQACDPTLLADVRDATGRPLGALHAQRAALGNAPFDGLLGAPFFAHRRVVFDVAAHRLLMTREDEGAQPR
jgi:hypothetical protein